jgi:hypothetical protein
MRPIGNEYSSKRVVLNGFLCCSAGAHRHKGETVSAIKGSDTAQMSRGTPDARGYADPAAGVSVRVLRAHVG